MGYENLRLENQLCVPLHRAARAIAASYRPHLDEIGLTHSQYSVMVVLWERGMMSVGDLGRMLGLDSGTLSPMIKRLEKAGYVAKRRSELDERVVEVASTEAGDALQARASEAQRRVAEATGLSEGEIDSLRAELIRLVEQLTGESGGSGESASTGD